MCQQRGQHRGRHALDDGAGDGHPANGKQFLEMELQAYAEHEQDDAHFRELFGNLPIGHVARCVRTEHGPG